MGRDETSSVDDEEAANQYNERVMMTQLANRLDRLLEQLEQPSGDTLKIDES